MKYYLVYFDNGDYVATNCYFFYSDNEPYGKITIKGSNVYSSKKEAQKALENDVPKYDTMFGVEFGKKINWKIVNPFTAMFYNLYDYFYNMYLDSKL